MFFMKGNGAEDGLQGVKRRAKLFARAEDGTMIIFGLFFFIIMLMAGGMAVDFMRFEHERARIQYTLDRAILAAGSLNQPLPTAAVVQDYFDKSDVEDFKLTVAPSTTSGSNFSIVNANANTTMNTFFLNMLGIEQMTASARGGALERRQKVELSLVLDVSGSMGRNNKLENLKVAAKEFIDLVLTSDTRDLISINIVPYNMQVNAGKDVLDLMQVTNEHNYSHCVDFDSAEFGSAALDLTGTYYQRTGHFDPFYLDSSDHPNTNYDDDFKRVFMCPTSEFSEMQLFSQDNEALKAKIDSFEAGGNTSIDIGVRWGAAFLDPSTQPIVSNLPSVPTVFDDRPLAYPPAGTPPETAEVRKFLVVMTDGVNTTQYTLEDDYKYGPSNVWFDPDSTWLGIRTDEGTGPDADNSGHRDDAVFFNSALYEFDLDGDGIEDKNFASDPYNVEHAVRLDWPEVWNMMSTRYNAYYNHYLQYENANDYDSWRNRVIDEVNGSTKNARLASACSAAKAKGVEIYTIGFEVTAASGQVMSACANSSANYFPVAGEGISDAFNMIANMIQRLKLVN